MFIERSLVSDIILMHKKYLQRKNKYLPITRTIKVIRLVTAGTGTLPRFSDTAPASIRSATLTPFIAGPSANIKIASYS
jgi:hypothetical protein